MGHIRFTSIFFVIESKLILKGLSNMRNAKTIISLFVIFICLLCSCSEEEKRLEYALDFAGENRPELEKVLKYYENDPVRFRAACFLIRNMPRYYSYKGDILDSLKAIRATSDWRGYIKPALLEKWERYNYYQGAKKIYDAQVITADFLIKNIDGAFAAWEKRTWNKYLTFDDFCEYILPYRIANEPLEEWRDTYYNKFSFLLDSVYRETDVVGASDVIVKHIKETGFGYIEYLDLPHLGASYLLKNRIGKCQDVCDFTLYVMRALGIPAAIDFYSYSPETFAGHTWNSVRDTTGQFIPFWFNEVKRGTKSPDGRKMGKAFRLCFGKQSSIYSDIENKAGLPPFFRNTYYKDATSDYFRNELRFKFSKPQSEYVYLGVFIDNKPQGIDIALLKNEEAVFKNVEPDVIYMPLFYDGSKYHSGGYPVLFDGEGVRTFRPNLKKERRVVLERKTPLFGWKQDYLNKVVGAKIEASCNENFVPLSLLYQIEDFPELNYNRVDLENAIKCRYVRYTSAKQVACELAELGLYDKGEKIRPVNVYGCSPCDDRKQIRLKNCYDNDPLTYFSSDEQGGSITFDLGEETNIDQFVYFPRNDDNFIRIGDKYELFYNDGENGWISLGKRVAEELSLFYNNVPDNALLWLHDITRGKEEKVFYMKNGVQMFCANTQMTSNSETVIKSAK